MNTILIEPDDDTDVILQCRLRATGAPAAYAAADLLSAELWEPTPPVYPYRPPILSPLAAGLPVGWLQTDPVTGAAQTGYDQGQAYASLPAAIVATLAPSSVYMLKVFRVLASNTARRERIATVRIQVRPNTAG